MARCRIHGREFEAWEGCSECKGAEERAEEERAELLEAVERAREERREAAERAEAARTESDYKLANPGDYECPECRYITLRRTATTCPKCHATVATLYWTPILEKERKEAEERERQRIRAAEEWARGEPERQRKAKADAEARAAGAQLLAREMSENRLRTWLAVIAWLVIFHVSLLLIMPAYVGSHYSDSGFLDLPVLLTIFAIPTAVSFGVKRLGK